MRRKRRTLVKIEKAFADAVAAGDFRKADGWLAVAAWVSGTGMAAPAHDPSPSR